MKSAPLITRISADPMRVSLPRFLMLSTSIVLLVGLGALIATRITGNSECLEVFFRGSGAFFLVSLAFFQFSLARMAVLQFSEGEPLQPAWFLIMLSSGCQLAGCACVQILHANSPLNPLSHEFTAWSNIHSGDIQRFGLLVGGPLQMLLLAGGLAYVLSLCRRTRILVRLRAVDGILLLVAIAGAYLEISHLAAASRSGETPSAYDISMACSGPLLIVLQFQAVIVRRYMVALSGGIVAKCWNSFAAAIFLTALAKLCFWLAAYGFLPIAPATVWYILVVSATAAALGPAWQIEAVQSACGQVGVPRFSPVAVSLAALRLLNTSR